MNTLACCCEQAISFVKDVLRFPVRMTHFFLCALASFVRTSFSHVCAVFLRSQPDAGAAARHDSRLRHVRGQRLRQPDARKRSRPWCAFRVSVLCDHSFAATRQQTRIPRCCGASRRRRRRSTSTSNRPGSTTSTSAKSAALSTSAVSIVRQHVFLHCIAAGMAQRISLASFIVCAAFLRFGWQQTFFAFDPAQMSDGTYHQLLCAPHFDCSVWNTQACALRCLRRLHHFDVLLRVAVDGDRHNHHPLRLRARCHEGPALCVWFQPIVS